MTVKWELRDEDHEFFAQELDDFVPPKIYDMHAHLWRRSDWMNNPPDIVKAAPEEMTYELYQECIGWILPRRQVKGLFFQYPANFPTDTASANQWISNEIKKDSMSRGQYYVRPNEDPDFVRDECCHHIWERKG